MRWAGGLVELHPPHWGPTWPLYTSRSELDSSSEDRHRDQTAADGPMQTSDPRVVCRRYWEGSCFWELASGEERPALGPVCASTSAWSCCGDQRAQMRSCCSARRKSTWPSHSSCSRARRTKYDTFVPVSRVVSTSVACTCPHGAPIGSVLIQYEYCMTGCGTRQRSPAG
jgi:hypothetical protein